MAKFMVLYSSPVSASDLMTNATPEQMKASMAEWIEWRDTVRAKANVDFGMPLQPVSKITPQGVTDSTCQVSGYTIIESDSKETVISLVQSHPHLKRPGASIDVLEMLPMPGM
jgi:hypothetical protein